MALTDIITKINDDAIAQGTRLQNEAEEEARSILTQAKETAERILDEGKEAAQLLGKETHDRTMSAASTQAKLATQSFKVSLIEKTFEEVEARLTKLSDKAYQEFVAKRAQSLPEKEGVITVSKERKDETLTALKAAGVTATDVKEAAVIGGFILETKTAEYNHTLKELLRGARERYAGEAADLLFAE